MIQKFLNALKRIWYLRIRMRLWDEYWKAGEAGDYDTCDDIVNELEKYGGTQR